jgi:hypothetical protein
MTFDQLLTYFDLPICPATQYLVLLYHLKPRNLKITTKVTKRACMARGRTPAETWMGTPDEVDFYLPISPMRHIFSVKREGASEDFCSSKGQKWRIP